MNRKINWFGILYASSYLVIFLTLETKKPSRGKSRFDNTCNILSVACVIKSYSYSKTYPYLLALEIIETESIKSWKPFYFMEKTKQI